MYHTNCTTFQSWNRSSTESGRTLTGRFLLPQTELYLKASSSRRTGSWPHPIFHTIQSKYHRCAIMLFTRISFSALVLFVATVSSAPLHRPAAAVGTHADHTSAALTPVSADCLYVCPNARGICIEYESIRPSREARRSIQSKSHASLPPKGAQTPSPSSTPTPLLTSKSTPPRTRPSQAQRTPRRRNTHAALRRRAPTPTFGARTHSLLPSTAPPPRPITTPRPENMSVPATICPRATSLR